jgi:hypothetical protein
MHARSWVTRAHPDCHSETHSKPHAPARARKPSATHGSAIALGPISRAASFHCRRHHPSFSLTGHEAVQEDLPGA